MRLYILKENYSGKEKIVAICTSWENAKEMAREWYDEEVEELSKWDNIRSEFNIPEKADVYGFVQYEVNANISIRSNTNSAYKYLCIEAVFTEEYLQ